MEVLFRVWMIWGVHGLVLVHREDLFRFSLLEIGDLYLSITRRIPWGSFCTRGL